MTSPTPAAKSASAPATHPCVRCGAPVALDVGLCERCNPLGLSDSASSQVHGTVFVAIVLAVVGLAVAGRLVLAGIGPFHAAVTAVETSPRGLAVTLNVRNEGTAAGSTTCHLTDPAAGGIGPTALIRSPRIEGGQSRSFAATVVQFGTSPRPLAVVCDSP